MLSVQMEQRVNLKFLVKLGKTFTEAYAMSKESYGHECLTRSQVFEWFKRFKEGRETTAEDDPRPGRPSTSKTDEKIGKLIREDRRLSIRGLVEITGIDKECARQILQESFNMRKFCAKMVPKLLTPKQKESRMNICADILHNIENYSGLLDAATLKGTRFESVGADKAKATEVLDQLTEADFQHCLQQWTSRMERCRDRQGEYIEGEKVATVIAFSFWAPAGPSVLDTPLAEAGASSGSGRDPRTCTRSGDTAVAYVIGAIASTGKYVHALRKIAIGPRPQKCTGRATNGAPHPMHSPYADVYRVMVTRRAADEAAVAAAFPRKSSRR
ncbi:hypothetical protein NQ318_019875 [Aromia moschata]|uniref:Mos1 transposase HTH domain-containing protein n=1 Tax=Aromia moschata TaxID=1265417 RepID=A0AAV8YK63_9CUCU|nr:hypothetical protein NQ318_019875 [Aromia moschata]